MKFGERKGWLLCLCGSRGDHSEALPTALHIRNEEKNFVVKKLKEGKEKKVPKGPWTQSAFMQIGFRGLFFVSHKAPTTWQVGEERRKVKIGCVRAECCSKEHKVMTQESTVSPREAQRRSSCHTMFFTTPRTFSSSVLAFQLSHAPLEPM